MIDRKKAQDATLVFQTQMDAGPLTDAQIRLKVKTLRAVLSERQRLQARSKYLKAHPELQAEYGPP